MACRDCVGAPGRICAKGLGAPGEVEGIARGIDYGWVRVIV